MALSFPYALGFLDQFLLTERVTLALQRFDERSGSGDGRMWSAQLAPPLWGATLDLFSTQPALAREINAKVYGLDGMAKTFLWSDRHYTGPASGITAGLGGVMVSSIRADRGAIGVSGLPVAFGLSAGDYLSIAHSSGRFYFGQFVEGGVANAAGNIAAREIRPYLPFGVTVGSRIELVRPFFKAMVTDFTPFANFRGRWGDSAAITILQKP